MQYRSFCVDEKPYCVWNYHDSNESFLRGIDTQYFLYLASTHSAHLDGEHQERAVLALSNAYYHGLETFFMLVYAALQAPRCVSGWLLKCWPEQLRDLVDKSLAGQLPKACRWKMTDGSWEQISNLVHDRLLQETPEDAELKILFAELWRRFARDYRQSFREAEYNSFKHGFRMRLGDGGTISWDNKPNAGEAIETRPAKTTLSSGFGSIFCTAKPLEGANNPDLKHHFSLSHCQANIDIKQLSKNLVLLGVSIHNVVAFLKRVNEFPQEEITVARPDQREAFSCSESKPGSLLFMEATEGIREAEIEPFTKEQILERLGVTSANSAK